MHVVRDANEDGLNLLNFAVADLEQFKQTECTRRLHRGFDDPAIGQRERSQSACVVDEGGRHDEAPLFVNQGETPVADAVVVAVISELELFRAS